MGQLSVFISWSGRRSQKLAQALHDWLPQVVQKVTPWMSSEDISAGARWANLIAGQLETTGFGIVCLTRENLIAPWVHFEAGAIAKSVGAASLVPYLLISRYSARSI